MTNASPAAADCRAAHAVSDRSGGSHGFELLSISLSVALALSAPAQAQTSVQTSDNPATAEPAAISEVVVSSTRISRPGFTSPTPTTVVGPEDLAVRATTTVSDSLFELPSIRPNEGGQFTSQNAGLSAINLRNLNGANNTTARTLILVDGQRFVPTTISGVVDSNVIPNALVERVEVVTGGASAAWGSDAIAGVVNFIFKKKIDGFQSDVHYGISQRGDNRERSSSLAWGSGFAGERGQFMLAGEFSDTDQRQTLGARDWSNEHTGFISGTVNGAPVTNIIATGLTLSNVTNGGVITGVGPTSPLRGIQFGPGGAVQPFVYGSNVTGSFMQGGGGQWYIDRFAWLAPVERKNVYSRVTFDFTDNVRGFVDGSFMESHSSFEPFPDYVPNPRGGIVIQRDDAFLPQPIANILAANPGIQSFQMGRINSELGNPEYVVTNKVTRAVIGLEGEFGAGLRWKTYYTHGVTHYDAATLNHLNIINWTAALDAVSINGVIVCRPSTVAALGAAPGCVPANPFGPGSLTSAVKNYVIGAQSNDVDYKQDAAGAQIQGEPFSTWAGKASLVGGYDFRRESLVGDSDPLSTTVWKLNGAPTLGAWQFGNPQPVSGEYTVNEVFAETVVPLLSDQPFSKSLDLNAAVRRADYSTSGGVISSKVGLTFKTVDGLMFRGALARDIRAPNLNELYARAGAINFNPQDYGLLVNGQPSSYLSLQLTQGNTNLKPEKSNDVTLGVTWQPEFLHGFAASVDYYSIDLKDAIAAFSAQQIIDGCYGVLGFSRTPQFCGLINRDPVTGRITSVTATNQNFQSITTKGVDYELSYRLPSAMLPGVLTFHALATDLMHFITNGGSSVVDTAGEIGSSTNNPKWRINLSAIYTIGPWTAFAQARYIDHGEYNVLYTPALISNNSIPSVTYLDASLLYSVKESGRMHLQVYGKIDNLLDKDPPVAVNTLQNYPPTNSSMYDVIGRRFTIGARVEF